MIGLVVEGGASRTYFAVGVMDAMMEAGIEIDYIGGASAGIANALSYATGQIGRSIEIGTKHLPLKVYSGFRHFLNPKNRSLYNIKYVFDKIPNELVPFDYEKFDNYKGVAEAAVTNVETGKCECIPIKDTSKGWEVIVASCSLPLMFPIVNINGKKYLDGGIADAVPFKRALDAGCDKVIVILSRERSYNKPESKGEKITSHLFRKYSEFSKALKNRSNMYNSQRKELFQLEKEGKAFVIAPEDTTGWKRTENRPERILTMYEEGYKAGINSIEKIKNFKGYAL